MPSNLTLGARALIRRPLSSAASVLCLGLGIAASAVALTLIDATAIRPYGLDGAGRLVVMWIPGRAIWRASVAWPGLKAGPPYKIPPSPHMT